MRDFLKRLIIVGIMALFISLLFIGGKQSQAAEPRPAEIDLKDRTEHWIWPTDGVVTDTYGTRNGNHNGIDIAGDYNSPVYAVDGGKVTKSYYSGSYGNVVFIKHDNGLETVYAHLGQRVVDEGQFIDQGDLIGKMGNTGHSSGVHLHFEVHENNWTIHKENALNPGFVIGNVAIGETVQAVIREPNRVAGLAKSTKPEKEEIEAEEKESSEEVAGVTDTIGERVQNSEWLIKSRSYQLADAKISPKEMEEMLDVMAVIASPFEENSYLIYSDFLLFRGLNSLDAQPYVAMTQNKNRLEDEGQEKIEEREKEENLKEIIHIVEKGENLWGIAEKYDTSFVNIMKINNLNSNRIHPGQSLTIKMDLNGKYVVQSGDNLTDIAEKNNKTVEEIRELNQLDSDMIHPQQILLIEKKDE